MNIQTNRHSFVDIARGIGILFVMYGHVFSSSSNKYLIYGFHLPLFFFLSGFVFSYEATKPLVSMIKKLISQTLLPYVLFGIATFIFWVIMLNQQSLTTVFLREQVEKFLEARIVDKYVFFNVPLWFLPCLFTTKLLFLGMIRLLKNVFVLVPILIASSVIGWLISQNGIQTKYFFVFEVACSAVVFFGGGYLCKNMSRTASLSPVKKVIGFILLASTYVLLSNVQFSLTGSHVDMRINQLHNYFLFYINAFLGIGAVLTFSTLLKTNPLLEYVGKNSLVLFVWHYPLYLYFTATLPKYLQPQTVESLKLFNPIGYTVAALILILGTTQIMRTAKQYIPLPLK